jgi:uncharacterized integral membrane protein
MPWKLVAFLSALIVAALFIGFNLDNRCDVSLIFYTFRNVPICVSLLVAFVIGAIAVIPFFVAGRNRRSASRGGASARRSGSSRSSTAYRDDDLAASSGRAKSSRKRPRTGSSDDFPSDDYDID